MTTTNLSILKKVELIETITKLQQEIEMLKNTEAVVVPRVSVHPEIIQLAKFLGWSDSKMMRLAPHVITLNYKVGNVHVVGMKFTNDAFNQHPKWCLAEIARIRTAVDKRGDRAVMAQTKFKTGELMPVAEWRRVG